MKCKCSVVIDNHTQLKHFCETIASAGFQSHVVGNVIWVEHEGNKKEIDKIIDLFEPYTRHTIATFG